MRDTFVRKYDLAGNELWTRQFGSTGDEYGHGIAVDSSGVYVTGLTYGTLPGQTAAGGGDGFVRKYDPAGNEVWTRQFGSSSNEAVFGIALDPTGVYVTGHTWGTLPGEINAGGARDAFVKKYDTLGSKQWVHQFGAGSAEEGQSIAVGFAGIYVVGDIDGGNFSGQIKSGMRDAFVTKIDPPE
jgi:hypothetical protein